MPPELEAIALVSLMEAADRVDSTTGVQMAYLKQWAARAFNDLELRVPAILSGPGEALHLEAVEAASWVEADVAYIDPPYNQHSYMGNYHVWESLVRWDKPETYGIANKRVQCREYKSDFNSKRRIRQGLRDLFEAVRCKHLLVSFNNEGHVDREEMTALLEEKRACGRRCRRLQALRRRADRHPQPQWREGRPCEPPAEQGVLLRRERPPRHGGFRRPVHRVEHRGRRACVERRERQKEGS